MRINITIISAILLIFEIILLTSFAEAKSFIVYNASNESQTYFIVNGTSGNVGIGINNPSEKLEVAGNILASGYVYATTGLCIGNDCKTSWSQVIGISPWDNSTTQIFVREGYPTYVNVSNALFVNGTSSNVGIGTTTPLGTLSIAGNNGQLVLSASSDGGDFNIFTNASGTLAIYGANANTLNLRLLDGNLIVDSGSVGIGIASPTTKLHVNGSLRVDDSTGSAILFVNTTSGNVGIGTTTPQRLLHVMDTVRLERGLEFPSTNNESYKWAIYGWDDNFQLTWRKSDWSWGGHLARFYAIPQTPGDYDGPRNIIVSFPNGNVGIGTTSPTAKLYVKTNDTTTVPFQVEALVYSLFGWSYRRPITISNSGSALTDYQVNVTLDTANLISTGKMQSDCDDIRFTDSDGTTLLNYWIESDCNTASTKIWVKIPSISANSNKTIYVYYGNPSASSASNATNTLDIYTTFDSGTLEGWQDAEKDTGSPGCVADYPDASVDSTTGNPSPSAKKGPEQGSGSSCEVGISKTISLPGNVNISIKVDSRAYSTYSGSTVTNTQIKIYAGTTITGTQLWRWCLYPGNSATCGTSATTDTGWVSYGPYTDTNTTGQTTVTIHLFTSDGWEIDWDKTVWFDNIIVRKYTSPEPTTNVGAEESLPQQQTVFYIQNATGNVGIGTTTPAQKLTVVGNIGIQAGANAFIGTLDNYALSLRTNNTDRIFITNTGNVGIGTTAPTTKLHVNGSLRVDNSTGSAILFVNDTSGNVGIGTTAPAYRLDVSGSARITDQAIIGYGQFTNSVPSYVTTTNPSLQRRDVELYFNSRFGGMYLPSVHMGNANLFLKADLRYNITATLGNGSSFSVSSAHDETLDSAVDIPINNLPATITWEHPTSSFEYTDVLIFAMLGWRGTAGSTSAGGALNAWKLEVYDYNNGTWLTIVDKSGVTDYFPIYVPLYRKVDTANYIRISKIRLTISQATGASWDTANLKLTEIKLIRTRGNPPWDAVSALSQAGGTLWGSLYVMGGGNVGIGTTSPTTKLHVNGSLRVDNSTGSAILFVNDTSGNVGIGTTTPDTKLTLIGSIDNILPSGNRHYYNVVDYNYAGSITGTLIITLPKYGSNTMLQIKINGYEFSGGTGGRGAWEVLIGGYNYEDHNWRHTSVEFKGTPPFTQVRLANNGTKDLILLGTTSTSWNYPKVIVSEVITGYSNVDNWGTGWSATITATEPTLYNVTTLTPKVFVDASGNVGIGTTAPGKILTVRRDSDASVNLIGTNAGVELWEDATPTKASRIVHDATTDKLILGTYTGAAWTNPFAIANGAPSDSMFINSSGNVGIGTTSPQAKLDVAGNLKIGNSSTTCDANHRGEFRVELGGSGADDKLWMCMKNSTESYVWALVARGG